MKNTYSPEIRQRAVRLYQEQRNEYPTQWAAIVSIASKFGCTVLVKPRRTLLSENFHTPMDSFHCWLYEAV